MTNRLLLRPEEAAERLGVGRTTVYGLMADGRLESVTIGRRRLVPPDALAAFVSRQRSARTSDERQEVADAVAS